MIEDEESKVNRSAIASDKERRVIKKERNRLPGQSSIANDRKTIENLVTSRSDVS